MLQPYLFHPVVPITQRDLQAYLRIEQKKRARPPWKNGRLWKSNKFGEQSSTNKVMQFC
uniref:Uncharacterized protein n=1 Tax=Anopheles arabiensis TaxID=7173 RepID=A0A182IFJ5_ANOAR